MPNLAPLSERHAGIHLFAGWPVSALRTLRAAAVCTWGDGSGISMQRNGPLDLADLATAPLKQIELCWRSELLGEPMGVGTASQGSRFLAADDVWDYGGQVRPRRPALGWRDGTPLLFQLNELGLTYAAISLEHYPPQCSLEAKVEAEVRPPDPTTPLWTVYGEEAEYLVLAADAGRAIALVEREHEGEMASRAVPVDTSAEHILHRLLR